MYEIRQVDDMLEGSSLTVTIKESELDKKALYTIEEAKPRFVLPFRAKHIDGKIELTYRVSSLCKLQYITGNYTVTEYVQLWRNVLSPLLECDDWFMKTQSFVLDMEHLYYDKDKKSVSYVYIPTKLRCSEHEDLKIMAGELAKQIPVMDMRLENKALRMIMDGFKPKEFLSMLNEYIPEAEKHTVPAQKNESSAELPLAKLSPIEPSAISSPINELQTSATQCISISDFTYSLRLVGSTLLPSLISVQIEDGEVFTIGRYDATVGRKQSSFEFERKTKAVSRRHAAIERKMENYSLIDLASSAGTFVDGKKLPPNTPVELEKGVKISFGTSGADYVWETGN